MRKFSTTVSFIFLSAFAASAQASGASEWMRVGAVEASCSFSAELDLLEGYPFARLRLGEEVVALAVLESAGCRGVTYRQVPEPRAVPTYDVSLIGLCMGGHLPVYTVTRSLSGVQEHCQIIE